MAGYRTIKYKVYILLTGITTLIMASLIIKNWTYRILYTNEHRTALSLMSQYIVPTLQQVDCKKIIDGDKQALYDGIQCQAHFCKARLPDDVFELLASNCEEFITSQGYITKPICKEEEDFPIAYSILMYKNVEQSERLLRAIYRPQNYYCIHVDKKSSSEIQNAVKAIAGCFDNVFVAQRSVYVRWGTFTVLEPELICMEQLWNYTSWKYFINLTGQEWPLKTNLEMVKMLRSLNGKNLVAGIISR